MSQLTRNGIAKDLKTSPYTFTEVVGSNAPGRNLLGGVATTKGGKNER